MARSQDLVDSVADDKIKTIAGAPAFYAAQAMGNAVAHQNRIAVLAETALAQSIKLLTEIDPAESVSVLKMLSGNDLAQQLSALGSAVAQVQQIVKGAQTTPPV